MSLRVRLFVLAIVAFLPWLALLGWNQKTLLDARYHEIETQVLGLAQQQSAELNQLGEGALQFLVTLAKVPAVQNGNAEECQRELESIKSDFPGYKALIRADLEGNITCSSIGLGPPIADRPYFKRVVETGIFAVGDFAVGRGTSAPSIHFAYPLRSSGKIVGVVAAALDLDWLAARLAERQAPGTAVNVIDRTGTILLRLPGNQQFRGKSLPDQFSWIIYSQRSGTTEVIGLDGSKQILGYVPIPASPLSLHVGVARDIEPATADIRTAAARAAVIAVLAVILSLSLAWLWGEQSIRRPFEDVMAIVRSWRRGEWEPKLHKWPRSEIGQLGRELDDLAGVDLRREGELRSSRAILDERQRYLSFVLDRVPAGIAQTRPDCTYAYVNNAFAEILGRTKDELIGRKFSDFTHPDDVALDEVRFKQALDERQSYTHRKRYVRPDGSIVWCENTVAQLEQGEGVLAISIDLTERMRQELQQQTLIDELNHRVKNTLSTVQALVAMSKRYTTTVSEFSEAFSGRLQALSLAHNLLTEGMWQSTSLRNLVDAELRPYDLSRFSITGSDFDLSPKQAIAFAMIIHELATNAAKYGALSVPSGNISVRWSLTPQDGFTAGEFDWKEHGGPIVGVATRSGFGSQLIKSSAQELGGKSEMFHEPDGIRCTVTMRLEWELVQLPTSRR